jgi:hypothetical protein
MTLNGRVVRLEGSHPPRTDVAGLIERGLELLAQAERCDDPERAAELEREAARLPIPIEALDREIGHQAAQT